MPCPTSQLALTIIGDPAVGSLKPRFTRPSPLPELRALLPQAWFLEMRAHFVKRSINSPTDRYHIATALLPGDLRCALQEHGERLYDTLQAYVMARIRTNSSAKMTMHHPLPLLPCALSRMLE